VKRKIIFIILSVVVISSGLVLWLYEKYKDQLVDQPPHFDLFVAETLFEPVQKESWRKFWGAAWNDVSDSQKRSIEWKVHKIEFETLDSIYLGIKNTSKEKFYYVTWGAPNSRIRISYNVYRNGKIDSIPFDGFGCGTGIFIDPIEKEETAGSKFLNPLMFNPHTGYELPIKKEYFPELFKEIYGDSVGITFQQATYSLPWNKTPSQMIKSDEFYIVTDKIIENWEMGKFSSNKGFEKEYEASFYFQKNDTVKRSKLYN